MSGEIHFTIKLYYSACLFVWLIGWFLNVLVNYKVISRTGPKTERLTILRAATHETERETMTSVSAGHIILTPTQPVGRRRSEEYILRYSFIIMPEIQF